MTAAVEGLLAAAGDGPAAWCRLLQVKADPDDLVQEAFVQAHQEFAAFRRADEGAFLGWLREVRATRLSRLARHYLGTRKRDPRLEQDLGDALADSSRALGGLAAPGSSPSGRTVRKLRTPLGVTPTRDDEIDAALAARPDLAADLARSYRHLGGTRLAFAEPAGYDDFRAALELYEGLLVDAPRDTAVLNDLGLVRDAVTAGHAAWDRHKRRMVATPPRPPRVEVFLSLDPGIRKLALLYTATVTVTPVAQAEVAGVGL